MYIYRTWITKNGVRIYARGEWDDYGRPRSMSLDDFAKEYIAVREGKVRPCELMKKLGLTKPTYYRYVRLIQSSND